MDAYRLVAEAVSQGVPVALATVIRVTGSTPREIGAKMVVYQDGRSAGTIGGGKMEASVIEAAVAAIAAGRSQIVRYELQDLEAGDPGMCGGTVEVYVDVTIPAPTLLLVGAGHVAMPTAEIAQACGFRVVVIDDRADMASEARFPGAAERLVGDIEQTLRSLTLSPSTYVVIVTRGHALDEEALHAVIDAPTAYVGMIGSRRKIGVIYDHLRAAGVPEEQIARVHAPIGIDIGSETPAEIAVSIVAELIAVRRGAAQRRERARP
ncbi:MAG: XdhC family protein [Anaerolineae bacterium]|nr:XdhC family protein [Anaerolineae bacterium]